jgi:hypothetical protein
MVEYPDDPDPAKTAHLRGDQGEGDRLPPSTTRYLWRLIVGGVVLGIVRWLTR